MTGPPSMIERQRSWLVAFAEVDCADLPLYRALSLGVAADRNILEVLAEARAGQWRPILLLAALHDLVLRHPEESFSRFFPTVGGSYTPGADPIPALREFIDLHGAELAGLIATRATQTNEPNRSCLWFAALRAATADLRERPVALVEIGPSAGLNLYFDAYSYRIVGPDGEVLARSEGDTGVELACEVRRGRPPVTLPLPRIVARSGLDLHRVDLHDLADRQWLKACIWPEQMERHRRFDAAVAHALADPAPPQIRIDDAVDGLADLLDDQPEDAHIVVINSWVMTYLRRDRRAAFDHALDLAGRSRDISWVSAEGEGVVGFVPPSPVQPEPHTVVGMARWRDGTRVDSLLARCHPHLAWMEWLA